VDIYKIANQSYAAYAVSQLGSLAYKIHVC